MLLRLYKNSPVPQILLFSGVDGGQQQQQYTDIYILTIKYILICIYISTSI